MRKIRRRKGEEETIVVPEMRDLRDLAKVVLEMEEQKLSQKTKQTLEGRGV